MSSNFNANKYVGGNPNPNNNNGVKRREQQDPRRRPRNQQQLQQQQQQHPAPPNRFNHHQSGPPGPGPGRFGARGRGRFPPSNAGRGFHQGRGGPNNPFVGGRGRGPQHGRGPTTISPGRGPGRGRDTFMGGRGGRGIPPPPPGRVSSGFPMQGSHYGPAANHVPPNNGIMIPPPPPPPPVRYPQPPQQQQQQQQQPAYAPPAQFPIQYQQQHIPQPPANNPLRHQHHLPPNPFGGSAPLQVQQQQQQPQQQIQPYHHHHHQQQQQQQQPFGQVRQPVPSPAATPNTVSYTKDQIDQAWTEHTAPNGAKFYHNSLLKTSTFTQPDCLIKKEATPAASSKRPWAEYADPTTGKKYYSDGVSTTWVKPADFVSPIEVVAQSNQQETTEPTPKKRKKADKETPFQNKEEAIAAFKGLLLAKDISPILKWHEIIKICSPDSRWDDCEAVLSTGERKQAMAEYQTKRANELRTKEREERARAKDAYIQMLTEIVPKMESFSLWKSRFEDIRDRISKDDRFYAVSEEAMRESLFLDFCEELRKHDERKKRNKKREAQDAFLSFLKEKEEAGSLSFSSTWNNFLSSLEEKDQEDSRFKASSFMTDSDRQVYFADFVIELQAVEDDKRRRIRDARRRAEKAQRDDFREALEGLASEGKLTPFSHWRGIERLVESHSSFGPVQEQDREAPREMFEEYIDEWDEIYRRDRSFLSHLVHPSSNREILVTPEMKYDEFVKALMEEAKTSPQLLAETKRLTRADDPTTSASLYFKELVDRAKDKAALLPRRRSHGRRSLQEDSSEDEGEIIEDGEIGEGASTKKEAKQPAVDQKDEGREIQKGDDNVTASNNVVSPSTQRKESASE